MTCSVEGCETPSKVKGLCKRHYDAERYLTRLDYFRTDERRAAVAEQSRARRAANPEAVAEYNRRYYAANRGREAERCRAWRQANPDRHYANSVRWRQANPEKARAQWQRKHAARWARIVDTRTDPVDYAAVVERHGMWCYLCEQDITTLADLHLDHVIPLALGGPHTEDNLRPAHALCNQRKGARLAPPTVRAGLAAQGTCQDHGEAR